MPLRRAAPGKSFAVAALDWIAQRAWPGNVRELRAAVECAAALAQGAAISVEDLAFATGETAPITLPPANTTLEEEVTALERRRILEALERNGHNHTHTARDLGLSRVGLLKKVDRMGLR